MKSKSCYDLPKETIKNRKLLNLPLLTVLLSSLLLVMLFVVPVMAADCDTCISCHGDYDQIHSAFGHNANSQIGVVKLFADNGHDSAGWDGTPPYFTVLVNCTTCHVNDLLKIHANNCSTCHPTPYDQLGGAWLGGCQQGGCHTTYHADVITAHLPWDNTASPTNDCLLCHAGGEDWSVPQTNCLNCHAPVSDTIPPVTTSDAQAIYQGGAVITFSMDDGGKVGVGTTFYTLDGGPTLTGGQVAVNTPGQHTLLFWSEDQAGNVESPPNSVTFQIFSDTTPPVTTSNVVNTSVPGDADYYQGATIKLTATDNSSTGVKATYYRINGGPVQTGTNVIIPSTPGTITYNLDFWSEDWGYNIETEKSVSFTVRSGFATLRIVWGNSDMPGFPYPPQPGHSSSWTIRLGSFNGTNAGSGTRTYPWNGVADVSVPLRSSTQKYFVRILWDSPYWGESGQADFPNVYPTAPGQVIRLSY